MCVCVCVCVCVSSHRSTPVRWSPCCRGSPAPSDRSCRASEPAWRSAGASAASRASEARRRPLEALRTLAQRTQGGAHGERAPSTLADTQFLELFSAGADIAADASHSQCFIPNLHQIRGALRRAQNIVEGCTTIALCVCVWPRGMNAKCLRSGKTLFYLRIGRS